MKVVGCESETVYVRTAVVLVLVAAAAAAVDNGTRKR